MSHCCLEVILPPTDDVKAAINSILDPFESAEELNNSNSFWDYWELGGSWAGSKAGGDVCRLGEMAESLTAAHVIVAGPYGDGKGLRAVFMLETYTWNGVSSVKSVWDGLVAGAVKEYQSGFSARTSSAHRDKYYPTPAWLVVTVDYHS